MQITSSAITCAQTEGRLSINIAPPNNLQHHTAHPNTILGNLDLQRKNKLSTKRTPQSSIEINLEIETEPLKRKCNKTCVSLHEHEDSNRIHTNQTRQFPTKSIKGCQFMLTTCVYDTNTILYRPLKKTEELQSTRNELFSFLTARGCKPELYRIENELSKEPQQLLKQTIEATVEIVPPNSHYRNAAERATRTAKSYLIPILSLAHDNFLLCVWYYLLQQAEIKLNLLHTSRTHPQLSA